MKPANDNFTSTHRALIKFAIDLGPLLIFFAANKLSGIYVATGVFMAAFFVALGVGYALERKLSPMTLITGGVVLIFGGLTLLLKSDVFIKLKPTLAYAIIAVVLLGGYLTKRPAARYIFEHAFQLDDAGWRILTLRWGVFFASLAVLNEIVWRNFSTDTWVTFKVFGFLPLIVIFGALQIRLIERHHIEAPGTHTGTDAKSGDDHMLPDAPTGLENGAKVATDRTDQ